MDHRWEAAFLGVSALLGELDPAASALDGGPVRDQGDLLSALRSPSRPERASAIARALVPVVAALDEMRLE
jgi:hypothetical protein